MADNKDNHYIDNQRFFEEMVAWKKKCKLAEEDGEPKPPINNYIGECFILIATKLSHKANFITYPYREEMVSDGIENCLQYCSNFDPEISNNPFSYFTQIIYFAFLRRISSFACSGVYKTCPQLSHFRQLIRKPSSKHFDMLIFPPQLHFLLFIFSISPSD